MPSSTSFAATSLPAVAVLTFLSMARIFAVGADVERPPLGVRRSGVTHAVGRRHLSCPDRSGSDSRAPSICANLRVVLGVVDAGREVGHVVRPDQVAALTERLALGRSATGERLGEPGQHHRLLAREVGQACASCRPIPAARTPARGLPPSAPPPAPAPSPRWPQPARARPTDNHRRYHPRPSWHGLTPVEVERTRGRVPSPSPHRLVPRPGLPLPTVANAGWPGLTATNVPGKWRARPLRLKRRLDDGPVIDGFDDARPEVKRPADWRGRPQLHGVVGGHGERRRDRPGAPHQVVGRRPVTVAVEEHANDSAVDEACERLVMRLGHPVQHDFVALDAALDAQPLRVRGPAPEAESCRARTDPEGSRRSHASPGYAVLRRYAPPRLRLAAQRPVRTSRGTGPTARRRRITTTTRPTLPARNTHGAT